MAHQLDDKTQVADSGAFRRIQAEAGQTAAALVLLAGPVELMGRPWHLVATEVLLGRAATCHIYVDDPQLSKVHARVMVLGDRVALVDLQSTNGTQVDGESLIPQQPRELRNNQLIQIGTLVFKYFEQGNLESASIQKAFERSQLDGLTQILNKGAYLTSMAERFKRARASGQSLSILVFDLDFFKKINDTYGHSAGDMVLQTLTRQVQAVLPGEGPLFARYGGEEFVVLLPGMALSQAAQLAERVRSCVESHGFSYGGERLPVTISVGVASLTPETVSAEALFIQADEAAYTSKREGRNRVTVAQPTV